MVVGGFGLTATARGRYADGERSGGSGAAELSESRQVREEAAVRGCLRAPPGAGPGAHFVLSATVGSRDLASAQRLRASSSTVNPRSKAGAVLRPDHPAGARPASEQTLKCRLCRQRKRRCCPRPILKSRRSARAACLPGRCWTPGRSPASAARSGARACRTLGRILRGCIRRSGSSPHVDMVCLVILDDHESRRLHWAGRQPVCYTR